MKTHSVLILILLCGVAFGLVKDTRELAYEWIEQDPNTLDLLLQRCEHETCLIYFSLIVENWLTYNPILKYNLHVGGRPGYTYIRGLYGKPTSVHPLEIGNLNGDNIIDLKDFAIYAGRYKR